MSKRGRPRTFDRTDALRQAMKAFWLRGYEGASMSDLTAAMGINSPSLYAAFGSKEALFREAVGYYNETEGAATQLMLDQGPTARAAIEAVLHRYADAYVDHPTRPTGCLIVLAATTISAENDGIRKFLAECRQADIDGLRRRFERGVAEGDLPPGGDTTRLAEFYGTVLQGMSLRARDGASAETLHAIAGTAMAAWPTPA